MSDPDYDPYDDEECSNCGGEGIVYMCHTEYACIDPEGGCDECARRCDWCQPPHKSALRTPKAATSEKGNG